jgi:hypothetical protein
MSALASPAIWLDVAIAALLVAVIVYAWQLNRRLAAWRADKAQLVDLVRDFNAAAERAERGIAQLKAEGDQVARALEALVAKGAGLRDDLAFIIERAEPLADRLADALRARRATPPAQPASPAPAATPEPTPVARPSAAERELLKALAGLR